MLHEMYWVQFKSAKDKVQQTKDLPMFNTIRNNLRSTNAKHHLLNAFALREAAKTTCGTTRQLFYSLALLEVRKARGFERFANY